MHRTTEGQGVEAEVVEGLQGEGGGRYETRQKTLAAGQGFTEHINYKDYSVA